MKLNEDVDKDEVELVRYIPQNFLEELCNEININKESIFDNELENVIFSHVEKADRLGCASLRELEEYKTNEIKKRIDALKLELSNINEDIITLEEQATDAHKARIRNELKIKWKELKAHRTSIPKEIPVPTQNTDSAEAKAITEQKRKLEEIERKIKEKGLQLEGITKNISVIEKVNSKLDNLEKTVQQAKLDLAKDLASIDLIEISLDTLIEFKLNKEQLNSKLDEYKTQKGTLDIELEMFEDDEEDTLGLSLYSQQKDILNTIKELQDKLDEPNRKYQKFLSALEDWQKKRELLIGSVEDEGSIVHLRNKLKIIRNLEPQIREAYTVRADKSKELYQEVSKISNIHSFLYKPIQDFINDENMPIDKDKFKLHFEVSIVESDFCDRFFDLIKQNVRGTFSGKSEGRAFLNQIIEKYDFNEEAQVIQFIEDVEDAITHDLRSDTREKVSVDTQLKEKKSKLELYNFIYSLDYLKPKYELKLGNKNLKQLSPGEKGTLLLVFYLLLDKDDIPLLIDQPEDNLDNQTVFELLVPSIKEVKKRRQIFIVTHNPNLAVVCDAEQIIHTEIDKTNKCRVIYTTGAIEDLTINQKILDVLEGTKPAFENRRSKYQVALR
jgi:predicted ATPase